MTEQRWQRITYWPLVIASLAFLVAYSWQVIANLLEADGVKVDTTVPEEGATGWSDTWMVATKAANPNCMYMWMDWITSPQPNAEVAEWFGEAPSNSKSCALTSDKSFCDTYHAADTAYWENVYFWTTPVAQCGDDRGAVCKDYSAWVQGWTEVKG